MTYQPHALLRFGGRWFLTESWSCGLRIISNDNSAVQQDYVDFAAGLLTSYKDKVVEWFQGSQTRMSDQARLDFVSLNAIDMNGHYADGGNSNVWEFDASNAPIGGETVDTWPQLTTCISLRTDVARGKATKGRIYAPTGIAATANGRIPAQTCAAMALTFSDFLESLAAVSQEGFPGLPRVAVVSGLGNPGPARIVTRVEIGDVMDTQRRRRSGLPEAYSAQFVTT